MGRHAAPRPRRRPWPLSVPLAAVLVLSTGSGTAAPDNPAQAVHWAPAAAADAVLVFDRSLVTTTPAPPPSQFAGMSLAAFLAAFEGTRTILPGYDSAECMAVFSHYHYAAVIGRPYSSPGAKDLWPQAWDEYDKVPASQPAQLGDVVTWSGAYGAYTGGGFGHVAIVIRDNGDTLDAFGQNPGAATTLTLSKSGVLGYLRPRHLNP